MAASLVVIWWRDIPAQVTAKRGRETARVELHRRFQTAIDRAAGTADRAAYDAYIAEWRREARDCGDDLEAEAVAEAASLEAAYPKERLARLAKAGGVDPERAAATGSEG